MAQPDNGIDSIGKAVEKTYEWICGLRLEMRDGASRKQGFTILRTVLQALAIV